jgi:hypothetical protein
MWAVTMGPYERMKIYVWNNQIFYGQDYFSPPPLEPVHRRSPSPVQPLQVYSMQIKNYE